MFNDNVTPDVNGTDRKIAKGIDSASGETTNQITLSTGVVLLAKPANPNMLIRAMTAHRRPSPPTSYVKEMGREMENPDDPDYISRVQSWQMEYSNAMLNVLIGLGTDVVSIPKGMEGPHPKKKEELPTWIKDYSAMGFPILPDSPAWRYITWIMFIAGPTDKDTQLIGEKVRSLSGVKEADVRDAENFPAGN